MTDNLPRSISTGEVSIMGITLRVHQLDNGQRIIEASDFERFMQALAEGTPMTQEEAQELARHLKG